MRHFSSHLILWAALSSATFAAHAQPPSLAARQAAPSDGWAGQEGGTRGGADATEANTVTVASAPQLRSALARGGNAGKIIQVAGIIDMSEAQPFTSSADQAARGTVRLGSNTTMIGIGPNAGFVNARVLVDNVSQVIVRNLHIRNPCDVGPVWDPADGARGNWNSEFDGITIRGSHHVWIDHNSFTDAPVTDDTLALENGKRKQCHDGAADITSGADLVTVSYNYFKQHEKNMLIGGSDNASGDAGHLRVSVSNNAFENVSSRSPRVRFGKVHVFNNYHAGDRRRLAYPHEYSIGVGKQAHIISQENAFDIVGATRGCADVVRQYDHGEPGATFHDSGSLLNGGALASCAAATDAGWDVPYPFTARPAAAVKAHVLANAGAGKLDRVAAQAAGCPTRDFLLCDDFERGSVDNWEASPGSQATLAVRAESPASRNRVLNVSGPGGLLAVVKDDQLASGDSFVEARIRPSRPAAAGNRQLYLVGHYVDAQNWVGAGLDLVDGSNTVQVQLVRMRGGVLSRLKQVARARDIDERFATVRLEMTATALTAYLNGEKITTAPQADGGVTRARIGLYSNGGGFEIDDLRFGVPGVQPARLAPALAGTSFTAQAGDPPSVLGISAVASDGVTRLPFTATSSDAAIVTVSTGDSGVTITPKAPGVARVVVSSAADPTLQTTIDATITPAFAMPARRYALSRAVSPAARATAVPVDTLLRIGFDRPPTLGPSGSVRIFRKADDALVDVIHVGEEIGTLGVPGQARSRYVRHTPIKITGNTVTIKPHANKLAYGTEYYVAVGNGVFNETAIAGAPFIGIGKSASWTFRTRPAAPGKPILTVDDDGPADFRTVQGALNHAMSKFDKASPVTIDVRNGSYEELLYIVGKDNLTIRGQSRDGVVIHATNSEGVNPGSGLGQAPGSPSFSGGRALLLVEESDLLTLDTLTLRNTTLRSKTRSGQAETLHFNDDRGRLIAKNASFFSEQDTIQVKGYAWFYRTLVAGGVDYIWGNNHVALFEESELRSVGDSANPASGGYLVQARTVNPDDLGFVFLNSVLTHGPGPGGNDVPLGSTYLARSPGTASTWDNVSFINCKMDRHVAAIGWAGSGVNREPAPNPAVASAQRGWREYGSTDLAGKSIDLARRAGGYALSAAEVNALFGSRAAVFGGYDGGRGWNPAP
jgi:pectate lyase